PLLRPTTTLFPYTTLFRSEWPEPRDCRCHGHASPWLARTIFRRHRQSLPGPHSSVPGFCDELDAPSNVYMAMLCRPPAATLVAADRKSTRLNSSHDQISYA